MSGSEKHGGGDQPMPHNLSGTRCLHILHLEDDPTDGELIQAELEKHDLQCRINRVSSEEEFKTELLRGRPDVILSDSKIPSFDVAHALALVRKTAQKTPVIVVSGDTSPTAREEAFNQGATEYISKDNLSHLPQAIRRACDKPKQMPAVGEMVIVQCERFRCLGFLDRNGKWRDWIDREELPRVIEWFKV